MENKNPKKVARNVILTILGITALVPLVVGLIQNVPGAWIYVKWTLICLPIITFVVLFALYIYAWSKI